MAAVAAVVEARGGRAAMAGRRQEAGAALRRRQERALRGTMRVVRELGPAAFLLQEDGRRGPPLRVGAWVGGCVGTHTRLGPAVG